MIIMPSIDVIILIALAVVFVHSLFWSGMIFDWVRYKYLRKLPSGIRTPLYGCPICMSPWWGTALFLLAQWTVTGFAIGYFLVCLAAIGGFQVLVRKLIGAAEDLYEDDSLDRDKI